MNVNKNKNKKDRYKRIIAQLLIGLFLFENCSGLQVVHEPGTISKQKNNKDIKAISEEYTIIEKSSQLATEMHDLHTRSLQETLDLNSMNVTINGTPYQGAGWSVSGAGDVNGDGYDDILIGAPNLSSGNGDAYIVYGDMDLPSTINLGSLNDTQGVTINGNANGVGFSVSGAGDVNGDGYSDILIGTQNSNNAILVYGNKNLPKIINLNSLNSTQGVNVQGASGSGAGYSVSGVGDVNKDGYSDMLIGTPYINNGLGGAYLIYGSKDLPFTINLGTINSTQYTLLQGGLGGGDKGLTVSGAGDVNGDTYADMLISGPQQASATYLPAVYLVYGDKNLPSTINLGLLNVTQGLIMQGGLFGNDQIGPVSGIGDINGDGYDDIIVGASNPNSAYVIYGAKALPSTINLGSINSTQGVTIKGNNYFGVSVGKAGDVNADGISDMIIGATQYTTLGSGNVGNSYVIYGSKNLDSLINVGSLNASQGITILGGNNNYNCFGYSVSGLGDINGDGGSDVIIGAPYAGGANSNGASYILYGTPYVSPTTSSSTTSSSTTGYDDGSYTSSSNTIYPSWLSIKGWYKSVKALWAQPKAEHTLSSEATAFSELQNKCKKLIVEADKKTVDKWYKYSLEDLQEDISDMLQNPEDITQKTVNKFKTRLKGINRDFLYNPLLEHTSFFGNIRNKVTINEMNIGNEDMLLQYTSSMSMLGSGYMPAAIGK